MRCSLFLLFVDMSRWAGIRQALFGQVHTSHQNTYHFSQLYKETGKMGRVKRKDRFQYQTVILLLRLDRIMPSRQTQKNLPLMKYDMCANGAPPSIQQPVITFRNKYTKQLLEKEKEKKKIKKKSGQTFFLVFGAKLFRLNKWRDAPLRIFTGWSSSSVSA